MSQNQPNESNSEAAQQLEGLIDLLFNLLPAEKESNQQAAASKQDQPAAKTPTKEHRREKKQPQAQSTTEAIPSKNNATHQPPRQTSLGEGDEGELASLDRQTTQSHLRQLIANLEQKLTKLEDQIYEPTDMINPLLPLITELLQSKSDETRKSLLRSLIPIIDEAIRQKIENSPHSIGKAIAPDIAFALQEQIQLERDSISRTLGPQMGEAIKNQIMVERDAMVDALYPVIGNTISKYMVEVVKDINQKVETALSPEGIKRKVRAKIQGVSEAELIFQEAMQYAVQAVFLIHKDSGLLIRDVQPESNFQLEADMIAGMLTAIRVFVNDSVAIPGEVSELHEIEYDASKIIIEVAGYCYLAVVVKGEPSKALLQKIRDTLGKIILDYSELIKEYNGDPATIPDSIQPLLVDLVETKAKKAEEEQESKSSPILLILLLGVLSAILIPLSIIWYRGKVANRIEAEIATALDTTPELSVYRLTPNVRQGKVILSGRVPTQYLQTKAAQVAREAAPDLELNNQIVAVDVPRDPVLTAEEVKRATALFNQREEVTISTRYSDNTVTVEGSIPDEAEAQRIVQGFEQIPGVSSVIATVETGLPTLDPKIYFEFNAAQLDRGSSDEIRTVVQFLAQYPRLHLNIIGHSDSRGNRQNRQSFALRRARAVEQALIEKGIERSRLHVFGSANLPPDVTAAQPSRLSRVVRFEPFMPPPTNQ